MALVKSLVQKLNGRGRLRLPVEGEERVHIEAERVFQDFVGKVKLAVQVEVLPAHGRAGGEGIGHRLALGRRGLQQILVEVQAIPAHNHVLDQPFAGIGQSLLFLAGVGNLSVLAVKHGLGERMHAFELVQLVVDALAQGLVVHVAEQKFGAHHPAQLA